ncbi:MAG: hypothetical protein AAF802_22765 [Planctomycetota bacterium]
MELGHLANAKSRLLGLDSKLQVVAGTYGRYARSAKPLLIEINRHFGRGCLCVLTPDDVGNHSTMKAVKQLCDEMPCQVSVDFGHWNRSLGELEAQVSHFLPLLNAQGLDRVAISAGSYPKQHSEFEELSVNRVDRLEWSAFKSLNKTHSYQFSDYGIVCGEEGGGGGSMMFTPALRYSDNDSYIIRKGKRSSLDHLQDQLHAMIMDLVRSRDFAGERYSWGDSSFKKINDSPSPGSLTKERATARKFEWNHHLAIAARGVTSLVSGKAPSSIPPAVEVLSGVV